MSLGIQLINILESIHQAGYVYNDLKLDNLMLDYGIDSKYLQTTNDNIFDDHKVNIIGFDFISTYIDEKTQLHHKKKKSDIFQGSMLFSSIHQLNFYSTSRRDDLISLFYLLVFLQHHGKIPNIQLV